MRSNGPLGLINVTSPKPMPRIPLQPRVILQVYGVVVVITVPLRTSCMPGGVWSSNGVGALEELHSQTFTNMPSDMAVHQPGTWIVRWEGNYQPSITRQDSSVAAWWVVPVQGCRAGSLVKYP